MTDSREPDLSRVSSPPPRPDLTYDVVKDGEVIGGGGQAIVSRTALPGPEPPDIVAVKEPSAPRESISREKKESFFEEAKTWQTLARREREQQFRETEHIVGIVAIGDELPWVAMEYMDGGSLADRLKMHPDGLPIDEALWITECLCRGLKLAHDHGVAHLDIKPSNILFYDTQGETWDVPKIADWGLARSLLEQSGRMEAYSVEYAAPEQFDADQYGNPDIYTDIYQLGAVVYEMLTGRPPYTGGQANIEHDVLYGESPTPSSHRRKDVPTKIDEVVSQALSSEKSQRYRGSVALFQETIERIRDQEESGSYGETSGHQTRIPNESSGGVERTNGTEAVGNAGGSKTKSEAESEHKKTTQIDTRSRWPIYRGNVARTGVTHTRSVSRPITEQWRYQTEGTIESTPVVVNGRVIFGSNDNKVYALRADTGGEHWIYRTEDWVRSSPAATERIVYVGSRDSHVYALTIADGERAWNEPYSTGYWVRSSPALWEDVLVVGSDDFSLHALDPETGGQLWRYPTGGLIGESSPAVYEGLVYIGSDDGNLYAVNTQTGSEEWCFETEFRMETTPAVHDGTVFIGHSQNRLYAIDAESGELEWTYDTGNSVRSAPAVTDEVVVFGADDEKIHAVDRLTGEEAWTFTTNGYVESNPIIANGTAYVGNDVGTLLALNSETGGVRWRHTLEESIKTSPVLVDEMLYVSAGDTLYALTQAGDK